MNRIATAGTVRMMVLALILAGCASAPEATGGAASAEVAASEKTSSQEEHQMTGSRLKNRSSTDRMFKAVGSKEAGDQMRDAPRPLNASGG